MKQFEISVLSAALAVGAAAGWFAAGFWGTWGMVGRDDPIAPVGSRVPRDRNGEQDGRARCPHRDDVAKPKRKAPIRSSSDAEVQRRILMGRVATLKKQLAVAKRMDEARKLSPSAPESDMAERSRICEEETNNLKKHTGKAKQGDWTVGEMLKYAPTFFADRKSVV